MSISQPSTNGHVTGAEAYGDEHRYHAARRPKPRGITPLLVSATALIFAIALVRILQRTGEL